MIGQPARVSSSTCTGSGHGRLRRGRQAHVDDQRLVSWGQRAWNGMPPTTSQGMDTHLAR
eukprot:1640590-Pyramimonas_sp.AAC.1